MTAPAGLPVTLNDAFGNLTASHLPGPVTLSNNSGNITTSDLGGRIQLIRSVRQHQRHPAGPAACGW